MPTYAYACTACDHRFEVVQSFSDDALTSCPQCEGRLRKLFNAVGVVFKGSGFYRTDSRSGSKASVPAGKTDSAATTSSSKSESKSESSTSSGTSSSSSSSSTSGSSAGSAA